jgi:hypothetical protein
MRRVADPFLLVTSLLIDLLIRRVELSPNAVRRTWLRRGRVIIPPTQH